MKDEADMLFMNVGRDQESLSEGKTNLTHTSDEHSGGERSHSCGHGDRVSSLSDPEARNQSALQP